MITADKGLAGAYNQNVLREAQKPLEDHEDTKLFVVGEYGRRYFSQHYVPIERMFLYTAQNPTLERAREISGLLLDQYDAGLLKKIFAVYTDMENGMNTRARSTWPLPFHRKYFAPPEKEKKIETPFEFEPSLRSRCDIVRLSMLGSPPTTTPQKV